MQDCADVHIDTGIFDNLNHGNTGTTSEFLKSLAFSLVTFWAGRASKTTNKEK